VEQGGHRVWYLGKRAGFDFRVLLGLRRVFREFDPHVVHTHTIALRYAFLSAWLRRVPARFHTIHSLADKEAGSWVWLRRLAFRCGVVPVAIADEVAAGVRSLYGIENPANIANGIPLEEYAEPRVQRREWRSREGISESDLVIVSVGRLDRSKNQALAIRALGAMKTRRNALLLFAGEGSADVLRELETLAGELDLGQRVRFLGRRVDIPDLLGAADLFALSSDFEGNPLTVLEAMAASRPVVATAVGGIPELVEHGVSGLLTPAGDVAAFSNSLDTLADDESMRIAMGAAAGDRARARFDVSAMASAYGRLYQERLRDRAP